MGNSALIVQILGVLLILFFFFATFMCTKTWKVWHVLFTFFTFAACVTFLIFASFSLHNRKVWQTIVTDLEQRVAEEVEEEQLLLNGSREEQSISEIRTELARVTLDRGRVWRNCALTGGAGNTLEFSTVAELQEGEQPAANGIDTQTILYVFLEGEVDAAIEPGVFGNVPVAFLGEFIARQTTETTLSLARTIPALPSQRNLPQANPNGKWAIYELIPLDTHEMWYEELDPSVRSDPAERERMMRAVMPNNLNLPQAKYDELINTYVRDGARALDSDPPRNAWIKVKFKRDYKVQVDVDLGADAEPRINADYFDTSGRAEIPRLKLGEAAEFEIGDEAILDQDTATDLINKGLCELVERIYVRSLVDYTFKFNQIQWRLVRNREMQAEIERKLLIAQNTFNLSESDNRYLEEDKRKLEEDLAGFSAEQAAITKYRTAMESQIAQVKEQARALLYQNTQMEKYLDSKTKKLTEEIERRTNQALETTSAPASL